MSFAHSMSCLILIALKSNLKTILKNFAYNNGKLAFIEKMSSFINISFNRVNFNDIHHRHNWFTNIRLVLRMKVITHKYLDKYLQYFR